MTAGAPGVVPELVERLGLEPHPEGGWFRRTWTAPLAAGAEPDARAGGSSILYLLGPDDVSRWHRIDASELWHHAAGAPLELSMWDGVGPTSLRRLGADVAAGDLPQLEVPPTVWQSARPLGGWSLATCVVVPEFRFDGFELAPPGWAPPP